MFKFGPKISKYIWKKNFFECFEETKNNFIKKEILSYMIMSFNFLKSR